MAWSRASATIVLTSPLGDDALIPISLTARESISQPFQYDIVALCQTGKIDPNALLDKAACITLQHNGRPARYFHGIVRNLNAEGTARGTEGVAAQQLYRLSLVPRLWFLSQTLDCRVYQNKSAGDILNTMFQDAGLLDYSEPPSSTSREYTVQFNESDLHFATRLMEEEGWYYFFQHTADKHKLVIANQNTAFQDIAGAEMTLSGGDDDTYRLLDFHHVTGTARGKMALRDYDPTKPDTVLHDEQPTVLATSGAPRRDQFRWPAVTFDDGTVTDRTRWEMEAAEAAASLYDGASAFRGMVAGGKFKIESKPASPYDDTYVVLSVTHQISDNTWVAGGSASGYSNHFVAFPSKTTWREPIATPRPRMDGIHTGLVLGPQHGEAADIKSQDGEEIYTDDLARVKVRFYWDHRGEATGGGAVWARVIQPWAGKGWGAQFIPRVGTEVAVAFVDGDPDRPIVVGGLYNGRDTPIYSKDDKTKLGIRSRSVQKGGASEFNEFTFDDKKGSELVYVQAQKDLKTYVKHDQTLTVDNCRIVTVKQDETVDIQNNQTIKVKQDHSLEVTQGNRTIDVKQGNNLLKVDMGNHDVKVAMGNHTTDVQMGNISEKADLGQISSEAMQSIELKVGQSSITLDQMGVTIKGMMISIEGQIQTEVKGLMTQVNADAMLMVKGAITMIN